LEEIAGIVVAALHHADGSAPSRLFRRNLFRPIQALTHLNDIEDFGGADAPITGVVWDPDYPELGTLGINGQAENNMTDIGALQNVIYVDPVCVEPERLCCLWW
jgi:hypothetical protein